MDRSIAAAVLANTRAAVMVDATTSMARALGPSVRAESVEGVEVRDHLLAAGCDLTQGWLYSAAGRAPASPRCCPAWAPMGRAPDRGRARCRPGPHTGCAQVAVRTSGSRLRVTAPAARAATTGTITAVTARSCHGTTSG